MRYLVTLALLALIVYAILDCVRAEEHQRVGLPQWAWVAIIVAFPGVGAIVWLVVSRFAAPTAPRRPAGPTAPDDDPEFLRELQERMRRERAREQRPDNEQDGDRDGHPEGGSAQ